MNPPPVVAVSRIPFFWCLDNVSLCPFRWKLLLFPYVNEQRLENVTGKLGVNFKKLCRNRILAWRLVVLQGRNGIKNFLSNWWVYPPGGSSGSGRFSTSEKCLVHLTSRSRSDVRRVPCLSLTGMILRRFSPHNCRVIL